MRNNAAKQIRPKSVVTTAMEFTPQQIDRIIEMAWEDRTPFDAIKYQFGLSEQEVIKLMRNELKPTSWRLWRERAKNVSHKHAKKNPMGMDRFKCTLQRQISLNKISKR